MTREEAYRIIGRLVATSPGPWDDLVITGYVDEFETLGHPDVLDSCVHRTIQTWSETHRIPLGVILSCYRSECSRLAAELASSNERRLPSGDRIVPLDEGVAIARQAYLEERRRLGDADPNPRIFEEWMAALSLSTPERNERRRQQREVIRRGR